MATVKTAISLEESLFEQIDALARELKISRSRLFGLAAREFIRRHQSQEILNALNEAYADFPDPEEKRLQEKMRSRHFELVKEQW